MTREKESMAAVKDNKNMEKTHDVGQRLTAMEKLLLSSVKEGKLELVKKILDKGASVNTADEVPFRLVVEDIFFLFYDRTSDIKRKD